MARNRIDELKGLSSETLDEEETVGKGDEIQEYLRKYESIKQKLSEIKKATEQLESLRQKLRSSADNEKHAATNQLVGDISKKTSSNATAIKTELTAIKEDNTAYVAANPNSAKAQMRLNLYQTHVRRFHSIMNEYKAASNAIRTEYKNIEKRQLKYAVGPELKEEELDRIVEQGKTQEVISKAMESENVEDLKEIVADIEERHDRVVQLAASVEELATLFKDLATLVDLQQESLDVIEGRILQAKDYTERGESELRQAEDYQKKARNRRCCIICILLAVLIAILAPVLSTVARAA